MEVFTKTKVVKLKSHLNKFLIADDDQETPRQSRSGSTLSARWIVEEVEENNQVIRIRSCHGKYLTASDEHLLPGMKDKKVLLTKPENMEDSSILWQPMKDGFLVKLKNHRCETFLRGNGGTILWRNSVTHDVNFLKGSSYYKWILWEVEPIELTEKDLVNEYFSMVSNFSAVSDELSCLDIGSPVAVKSIQPPVVYKNQNSFFSRSAMEVFQNAKTVRLRSTHNKFLTADDNQESVRQDKHGSSRNSKWTVEIVPNSDNIVRLKSCYNKYLTASNHPFLFGTTGKKVIQKKPKRVDSSVEWEPIREGQKVKLRTRYGHFLRANGGLPPWRNSVTYDIPYRTATKDWVFWDVDVVEMETQSPVPNQLSLVPHQSDSFASESFSGSTFSSKSATLSRQESYDSMAAFDDSPRSEGEGRVVYYHVADKCGIYDDEEEEVGIVFKGDDVEELRKILEEVVGVENVVVCTKSPLDGELYPLRLKLPPSNESMHVVLVPSSSNGENGF